MEAKINIYREIVLHLHKRRKGLKIRAEVKLITMQEIIDTLVYLEGLKEPVKYIEETLVRELNFD